MKRFVLLAAFVAAAPLVGCGGDGSSPQVNHPFKKKPIAAAPSKANYFEIKKDKKTYVLGSAESIPALGEGASLKLKEMPKYGPKGETVLFEESRYTDYNRLVAEYRKNHNLP